MTTPLYPTFEKRIRDAIEQLIIRQVTPWSFMAAGPPFRVNHFDGRVIAYQHVRFDGSPRDVFWGGYIEPFLEDISVREISTAVTMAKERNVDGTLLLPEVRELLSAGIKKVYTRMTDVDRRLRGKGYPNNVALRSVEFEIQRMDKFLDQRILAEIAMWRRNPMTATTFTAADYTELDHLCSGGDITKASKAELERYAVMLLRPHAYAHFSASAYPQICETVRTLLRNRNEESTSVPVTEPKKFPFVKNTVLRRIVERDYQELQQAFTAKCWKSVIVLSGGTIETILMDLLLRHEPQAKASKKAHKEKDGTVRNVRDWGLVYLILVAVDLNLVNPGVDKHSHSLREYRDLVHPMVEIKSRLRVDAAEARIALEVLNMIHRDLSTKPARKRARRPS
jgi:hypothetical protein